LSFLWEQTKISWSKSEEITLLVQRSVDHKCHRKISDRVSEKSKWSASSNVCSK